MPALLPDPCDGMASVKYWLSGCFGRATKDKKERNLVLDPVDVLVIVARAEQMDLSARIHGQGSVCSRVRDEIKLWNMAGAGIPFDPG